VLRRRWFPWLIFGATLVSAAPLAPLMYLVAPKSSETPNCGGIGWGEVPCGWDSVALTFVFAGVPYAFGLALVLGISEGIGQRATFARSILALTGLAIPWLLVFVVLVLEI
jgi:hypothetical protein